MKTQHLLLVLCGAIVGATVTWFLKSLGDHEMADEVAKARTAHKSAASSGADATVNTHAPAEVPRQEAAVPAVVTAKLAQAQQLSPGFERRQLMERLGFDAAAKDPNAALQQLASLTGADRASFLRGVFEKIAALAPKDALGFAKKLDEGQERVSALKTLASAWRGGDTIDVSPWQAERMGVEGALGAAFLSGDNKNPELAAVWAQELLSGKAQAELLGRAAFEEAATDPQRALAFGEYLTGEDRDRFLARVAGGWAKGDPAAAWAWAQQAAEPDLRAALESSVLRNLADTDPRGAADLLNQLPAGQDRNRAIASIAQEWASKDTQAALDWANSLANPNEQKTALNSLRAVAPIGIGVSLGMSEDGYPQIAGLVPGGPAGASGLINADDRIAGIDKGNGQFVDAHGLNMRQIIDLIRGDPGSSLRLQIIPPGATSPTQWKTVTLVRNQIIYKQP